MRGATPKYLAWTAAEQAAQAIEQQLAARMRRAACGPQAAPADAFDDEFRTLKSLRREAHGRFVEAMQEVRALATSLHHRRVLPPAGAVDAGRPAPDDVTPRCTAPGLSLPATAAAPGRRLRVLLLPAPQHGLQAAGAESRARGALLDARVAPAPMARDRSPVPAPTPCDGPRG